MNNMFYKTKELYKKTNESTKGQNTSAEETLRVSVSFIEHAAGNWTAAENPILVGRSIDIQPETTFGCQMNEKQSEGSGRNHG